jgi:hypothetical protein
MRGGSAVAEISISPAKQERKRVLQAAGEEQEHRELGDVEASSQAARSGSSRCIAGKRMRSAIFSQASAITARQVRSAARNEPVIDHEHGGGLADRRAQPHQRIETHAAPGGVDFEMGRSVMPTIYPSARALNVAD